MVVGGAAMVAINNANSATSNSTSVDCTPIEFVYCVILVGLVIIIGVIAMEGLFRLLDKWGF